MDDVIRLAVGREGVEAFMICVAIGTLHAIDRGALPASAGIWCLGRPVFSEPLARRGLIDPEVARVLAACDEIEAVGTLAGEVARKELIAEALARLEARLRAIEDPEWCAAWEPDGRDL